MLGFLSCLGGRLSCEPVWALVFIVARLLISYSFVSGEMAACMQREKRGLGSSQSGELYSNEDSCFFLQQTWSVNTISSAGLWVRSTGS